MKRNKAFIRIASGMLAAVCIFGLVACGGKQEETTTAAPETTVEETTAETPAAEPETLNVPQIDYDGITRDLMRGWNQLNRVASGALQVDTNHSWTDPNGFKYNLVTEEGYQNYGAIFDTVFNTVTGDLANKRFPYLAEPSEEPFQYLYLEEDTVDTPGLYMLEAAKGFFGVDPETEIEITNYSDTAYDATFDVDAFGSPAKMSFHIINTDDGWRIDSVVDPEP